MVAKASTVWRRVMTAAITVTVVQLASPAVRAHHSTRELQMPSATCGWIEGDSLRDRGNLAEFCARWVPKDFHVTMATAMRERLFIETPPDIAASLRGNDRTTEALLRAWLDEWRTISGYRTAAVVLLRSHAEFAKIQTTIAGDAVSIR